jgi:hypothetical protein
MQLYKNAPPPPPPTPTACNKNKIYKKSYISYQTLGCFNIRSWLRLLITNNKISCFWYIYIYKYNYRWVESRKSKVIIFHAVKIIVVPSKEKNAEWNEERSHQQQKGAAAEQHGKDEVVSSVWLAPSFLSHAAAAQDSVRAVGDHFALALSGNFGIFRNVPVLDELIIDNYLINPTGASYVDDVLVLC